MAAGFKAVVAGWMAFGLWVGCPAHAAESPWDHSFSLQSAVGHKDNLLLSRSRTTSSGFWQGTADALLTRIPEEGARLTLFGSGEARRYFDGGEVDGEQLWIADGLLVVPAGPDWEFELHPQYIYLDQVMDASVTEAVPQSIAVRAHIARVTPTARWIGEGGWSVEAGLELARQDFEAPLDDFWEATPGLKGVRKYGHRSEISLGYELAAREYDTRAQMGLDYLRIADTTLRFQQHEAELVLKHNWNAERTWRTVSRVSHSHNLDNGPGFYDYRRWRVVQELAYRPGPWEFRLRGRVQYYNYTHQPVGLPGGDLRRRQDVAGSFRVQREIGKRWLLFGQSEWEQSNSNEILEEYTVSTHMFGAEFRF